MANSGGSSFLGFAVLLGGVWFIDSAVQNRPPIGSLKGILSQKPSDWASTTKTFNGTLAAPATAASGSGTTGAAPGGTTTNPPAQPKAKSGSLISKPKAPVVAPSPADLPGNLLGALNQ